MVLHLLQAFCVEYVVYIAHENLGLRNYVCNDGFGMVQFIALFPYRQISFDPFLIFEIFAVAYTAVGM